MQNFIEFYRKYFPCCQKVVSGVWGLRTIFWANWGQKTYKFISPELWLPFSQTRPDFMQNFKLNKMFYLNIRIYLWLGVWGLKNSFGPIGPKRLTKPSVQHPSFNFHKQGLILSKIKKVNPMNFTNVKTNFHPGVWDLKPSFELTGSKRLTKLELHNLSSNFCKPSLNLCRMLGWIIRMLI